MPEEESFLDVIGTDEVYFKNHFLVVAAYTNEYATTVTSHHLALSNNRYRFFFHDNTFKVLVVSYDEYKKLTKFFHNGALALYFLHYMTAKALKIDKPIAFDGLLNVNETKISYLLELYNQVENNVLVLHLGDLPIYLNDIKAFLHALQGQTVFSVPNGEELIPAIAYADDLGMHAYELQYPEFYTHFLNRVQYVKGSILETSIFRKKLVMDDYLKTWLTQQRANWNKDALHDYEQGNSHYRVSLHSDKQELRYFDQQSEPCFDIDAFLKLKNVQQFVINDQTNKKDKI